MTILINRRSGGPGTTGREPFEDSATSGTTGTHSSNTTNPATSLHGGITHDENVRSGMGATGTPIEQRVALVLTLALVLETRIFPLLIALALAPTFPAHTLAAVHPSGLRVLDLDRLASSTVLAG